jgi:anaerobic selenocysteine-containing dehydrogenase
VRTGYSAIADEWIGITPGTDGLLVLAIVHELLKADRIDLDFLVRYTNAPWLVVEAPGTAGHGLFVRDNGGNPLCADKAGAVHNALAPDIAPRLVGEVTLSDGRKARTVFELMAARYLDEAYAPEKVAEQCGVPAATIRRIAAELAEAAFEHAIEIPVGWVDWAGRYHDKIIGRPVSMHAMRGVSAHSNGFQTCRAIHLLQMLLGSIDCPGGFRYKPPFPKAAPPPAKPGAQVGPMHALHGLAARFPDRAGRPAARHRRQAAPHRQGLQLGSAARRARHDAHGDPQRLGRRSLSDRHAVLLHGEHGVELGDERARRHAHDERQGSRAGQYKIPHIIYADAFFSEMVAYADLVFPDTTYLERWDCISLLDRPISDPDAAGDAIRRPVIQPDRDVRPFQDVLLDLGARLKLPGMIDGHGKALYPGGLKDYMVWHERRPGIGMLSGWRGHEEDKQGMGEPNRRQLDRYIENGCFWRGEIPEKARFYRFANRDFFDWAIPRGFSTSRSRSCCSSIPSRCASSSSPPKATARASRRIICARAWCRASIRCPSWYPPFGAKADSEGYVLHAITQRPMHMYHSWGSQNAWLRQIQARNPLFIARKLGERLGLADGDWVWIESPHGQVKAEIKLMEGVNQDTVWTWNASASAAAPGTSRDGAGISERLPAQPRDLGTAAAAAGRASLRQHRSGDGPGGVGTTSRCASAKCCGRRKRANRAGFDP